MKQKRARLKLLVLAGAAVALAGCETSERMAASASVTPIGFEGFVGVPRSVGENVARELVRASDGRRFVLVAADDRSARYLMRGYLAPRLEGGGVAYVWDLFDRTGERMQRLSGDVALPPGDAWTALSNGAARPLALASVGAIDGFLVRPASASAPAAAPPAIPAAPASASPAAASTPAAPAQAGRRVVVEAVAGLDPPEAGVIAAAMRRALTELGYAVQPPGSAADIVLSADVTLNPPHAGQRFMTIAWRVANGAGQTLGEIRQMARLPESTLLREGAAAVVRAIDTALPGLVALAPPR